jgi:hypothetical protein
MSTNFDDLFAPAGVEKEEKTNFNATLYKPNAKDPKAKGNIYSAIIRFVPNINDTTKNLISKYTSYIVDPITNIAHYVDDPRSIERESVINKMYWNLVNSHIPEYEMMAKKYLGTKQVYFSLVQIVKDIQHPELEGKIMVWQFGKKVWDKIISEENPDIGKGTKIFDPIRGRLFSLKVTLVSGFNNYDQSTFVNFDAPGIRMPDGNGGWIATTDQTDRNVIVEYLKANSPVLEDYGFKEWSSEITNFVNGVISTLGNMYTNGQAGQSRTFADLKSSPIGNPVAAYTAPVAPAAPAAPLMPPTVTPNPFNGVDLNGNSIVGDYTPSVPPVQGLGSLDDILNGAI